MRKIATLAAISVLALGTISASDAEARHGRRAGAAVAAGIVGVAAGAILAGAASSAYAAPVTYGYAAPVTSYHYGAYDGYYPAPVYRERRVKRVVRYYERPRPVYRTRRVVRSYDYDYAPVSTRTVTYSYGSPYYGSGYYGGW